MPFLFYMLMMPYGKKVGLLTVNNSHIKHGPEILNLLEAVKLLEKVLVMHCKGHQKNMSPISQGNRKAQQEAKQH